MSNHEENNEQFHIEGGIPVFNARLNEVERKQVEAERRDQEYKAEQQRLDRLMVNETSKLVLATVLLFLTSLIANFVAGYQACVSKRSVKVAEDALAQAKTNTTNSIEAQKGIAAQSLQASQQTASQSLNANIAASQFDQRAWLGTSGFTGRPEVDKPFQITVGIRNTGRTPATNVRIFNTVERVDRGEKPTFKYPIHPESRGVVEPNNLFYLTIQVSEGKRLEPIVVKNIDEGAFRMYVYGKMTYDDVFRHHHWRTFCSYLRSDLSGYDLCDKYNDVDRDNEQ